jgi:hypothetical protein
MVQELSSFFYRSEWREASRRGCSALRRRSPVEECVHASLAGNTPLGVIVGKTVKRVELDDARWVSHCRGLVQLPVAA